jgi:hypothetical protein
MNSERIVDRLLTRATYTARVLGKWLFAALVGASLVAAAPSSATSTYSARVAGIEVLPITSTLGTFTGVATAPLAGEWRAQILHQPLRTGRTVTITGGSLTMRTLAHGKIVGAVDGGSVAVVNPGAHCTDQTYAIDAALSVGRFTGTLTHHRRHLFGICLIYSATISGRATLTA